MVQEGAQAGGVPAMVRQEKTVDRPRWDAIDELKQLMHALVAKEHAPLPIALDVEREAPIVGRRPDP